MMRQFFGSWPVGWEIIGHDAQNRLKLRFWVLGANWGGVKAHLLMSIICGIFSFVASRCACTQRMILEVGWSLGLCRDRPLKLFLRLEDGDGACFDM